jgi:hypothetical protein
MKKERIRKREDMIKSDKKNKDPEKARCEIRMSETKR